MTRALVATGPGEPLEVREVELRPLTPVDVRVEVAGVGVCHSDLSMVNGTLAPSFPLVLGHEAAGVVSEVGDRVTGVEVVVLTEDGGQLRIPLVHRHGAWWAP